MSGKRDRPRIAFASERLRAIQKRLADDFDVISIDDDPSGVRVLIAVAEPIDPALLDKLPELGLVALVGTGYDKINRAELARRGVQLTNTAGVNAEDVADLAVALVLALVRCTVVHDARVRSGQAARAGSNHPTRSMSGLRIGIVGLGGIGRATAARLEPFGVELAWWGPRRKPEESLPRAGSLIELARRSDLLLVASRASDGAPPLIDAAVIDALGARGMIVNVSRGQLIDEDYLIEALKSGRIGGAGLDVFHEEPPSAARWAEVPNTVLSPHMGGNTDAALDKMIQRMKDNISAFLNDEPLPNPVPT